MAVVADFGGASAVSPTAGGRTPAAPLPGLQRARGSACVSFHQVDGRTRLARLRQEGAAKIRLPRVFDGEPPTAVVLNTAGGVTGGDRFELAVEIGDGAAAVVTTQAAERLYRRLGDSRATIETRLRVGAGARLDWVPQEMIVFDGSALSRRILIDIAADSRLLAVESLVLGRTARGERVRAADLADRWRLVRGGRLVFADALRLDGDPEAILAGAATGGGARALATVLFAAPDAEARLEAARERLAAGGLVAGVSHLEGVLVARLLAADGDRLRGPLADFLVHLGGSRLPPVWRC